MIVGIILLCVSIVFVYMLPLGFDTDRTQRDPRHITPTVISWWVSPSPITMTWHTPTSHPSSPRPRVVSHTVSPSLRLWSGSTSAAIDSPLDRIYTDYDSVFVWPADSITNVATGSRIYFHRVTDDSALTYFATRYPGSIKTLSKADQQAYDLPGKTFSFINLALLQSDDALTWATDQPDKPSRPKEVLAFIEDLHTTYRIVWFGSYDTYRSAKPLLHDVFST